ncbi:MAG: hypothetical protein A2W22_02370 [Candidatus Levybacteria bacterium RBG_16_35_11]|nr:MAG: hypothetical protein A2W22_02370 [Candidatus Levybacteria bacterium RBG_16_35_11]
MDKKWIAVSLSILFFILGFLVQLEQYLNIGVWFQMNDVHHETFALSLFTLAIGILIGSNLCKNEN